MAITKEDFINEIKNMKVIELNELIKEIEKVFGVSAAAPISVGNVIKEEENVEKTVVLKSPGTNKIAVIKLVREILGLGLMDAKKFADNGGNVKEKIDAKEAEELATKFKELGAEVEVK